MSTLTLDPYSSSPKASTRSALPENSVKVAVAVISEQMIGMRESYWLSPAGDGQPVYELWHGIDELPGQFTCGARLADCAGTAAKDAAEQLLAALWFGRHPMIALISFEEAGLVGKRRLNKLLGDYVKRRQPKQPPKSAKTVRGILHYEGGCLKYKGEMRGKIPNGQGTGYWENGNVWCEGGFMDGRPHGLCRMFYPNGNLRHEGEFVEGYPAGPGKEYRQDGILWFEGVFGKQSDYYHYGARIWVEGRRYDDKGRLEYEGRFVSNGKTSRPVGAGDSIPVAVRQRKPKAGPSAET